jgi:hypothetical protein
MNGFRKMWHMYIVEYYLAMMKNEITSIVGNWMKLWITLLSKIAKKKNVPCFLSYVESGFIKANKQSHEPNGRTT